jgi:hypothetical protein
LGSVVVNLVGGFSKPRWSCGGLMYAEP